MEGYIDCLIYYDPIIILNNYKWNEFFDKSMIIYNPQDDRHFFA